MTKSLEYDDNGIIRTFASGATRDTTEGKPEPWGFTSAMVEKIFCEYMDMHRTQSDGSLRASDNWKKGFDLDSYWHSMSRHVLDFRLLWEGWDGEARTDYMIEALCGIKFNVDALILELKKAGMRSP
jgi:hypothetical protein